MTVSMTVAIGLALQGFWPILPFAGAELLALAAALYCVAVRGTASEVVSVQAYTIEVEKGRRKLEQRWEFPRAWAQIRLVRPRVAWYPSRLVICSHGRQVELGGFLNEDERRRLASELRRAIVAAGQ